MTGRTIAYTALFAALFAICAWLTVPFAVPFTMQTFAVLLAAAVLGARRAIGALTLYVALGLTGLPVFSGFVGGFGVFLGPTGGYLLGFFPMVLVTAWLIRLTGRRCFSMACGTAVCYAFGTAWYLLVYMGGTGAVGLMTVLAECVLPFLLPDAAKILLAAAVAKRLERMF